MKKKFIIGVAMCVPIFMIGIAVAFGDVQVNIKIGNNRVEMENPVFL